MSVGMLIVAAVCVRETTMLRSGPIIAASVPCSQAISQADLGESLSYFYLACCT